MNKNTRKFQEREFFQRIFKLLPKILFVTIATVAVVVTTQVFKSPKVEFLNVFYEDGALNYEINIDSTDTKLVENSLSIVLTANNERYEKEGIVGYQSDKFNVVLNRTYKLTVEGDVGLGTQVFAEKEITIKDKPSVNLNRFIQFGNILEISFNVVNETSLSERKVQVQVLKDLETVYFEEHFCDTSVNLTIEDISINRNYTLRILNNKEIIFEKTIKTTDVPSVSASFECYGDMMFYYFHIEDFYNRLDDEVFVEVRYGNSVIFKKTHKLELQELCSEVDLEGNPQGIYTFIIYGFINQKKVTLYEDYFYKTPSGEINYTLGMSSCYGEIYLFDDEYKINDYTLYLTITNNSTFETTKIKLGENLKFSFLYDKNASYSLELILVWKGREYHINNDYITSQVMPVSVSLNPSEEYLSYYVLIENVSYVGSDSVKVVFDHLISSNDQIYYFSSYEFSDTVILDFHGPYSINVYLNNTLLKSINYYHAPQINSENLVITSDETSLNAYLQDDNILEGVTVCFDLYLDNVLIERLEGRDATFTNLVSYSTYEIRVVLLGDREYTVCTKEYFFTSVILGADISVEVVSDAVHYSFSLTNPVELPTDEFRVELMKGENYLESETTTEFTGSFSVFYEGDYTINVYYNNQLIGSRDFYKLPTAWIYYEISSYQIYAEASIHGTISDTPEVYLDLYFNDDLIERYQGAIHGFENLEIGNTYDIRVVYVVGGVEHILNSESILFHEPVGQEEIRIITADYIYNPDTFDYKLVVTYKHTMSNSDVYLLFLKLNNEDVYMNEFVLDGTPLVCDNLTSEEIFPYATVHIRQYDTDLATSNLTNRYEFAVVDFNIDSGVIYYDIEAYIRLEDNISREMNLIHTVGGVTNTHTINNSMYQTRFTGEIEGGGEGINTLEYVLDGNIVGCAKRYITPTGSLDLEDDGLSLFANATSPNPISEPLLIRVISVNDYMEMPYEGQKLQFDDLSVDTPLTVSLIATVDYNEYIIDEVTYVVSTFFESFVYYGSGDNFYLTWNANYPSTHEPTLKYTIYFDEALPMEGTIDFASLPPGTNTIEIPYTVSFTTAKIVIYDITDSNNYKLIGERKAFLSV